jgi:hypothetical protein
MTKSREVPSFEVLVEDIKKLKKDLKDLGKGTNIVVEKSKSIENLAYTGSPELKTLETPNRGRLEPLKRDAMAIDIAGSLEILATGLSLIAKYAIPSAYAIKSIHIRVDALEKSIDKIANETNVDLSTIKKEMVKVKETLQSPLFTDAVQMFKEGKESVEKNKKRGEETFDNLTRSH